MSTRGRGVFGVQRRYTVTRRIKPRDFRKRPVGCIIPKRRAAGKIRAMNEEPGISSEAPVWQYRHPTEAERAEWVRRFRESKLSLREFTIQNDVGYSHVSMWRWINRDRVKQITIGPQSTPAEIGFTEVKLEPPVEQSQWVIELSLPGGKVLRLSKDVPAAMLEQLLRVC